MRIIQSFLEDQQLYSVRRQVSLVGCFDVFKQSLNECFKCQAVIFTHKTRFAYF